MLLHKDGGANVAVKNCMSHFYMFVPTKSTVKLAIGNKRHDQGIEIILCNFPNCPIIYPVVSIYYCPDHPSNNISPVALKNFIGFQKVTSDPIEHCDFVDPQGCSWISPYQNQNNLDYLQIEIVKFNPQINRNIVVPTICDKSKKSLSSDS